MNLLKEHMEILSPLYKKAIIESLSSAPEDHLKAHWLVSPIPSGYAFEIQMSGFFSTPNCIQTPKTSSERSRLTLKMKDSVLCLVNSEIDQIGRKILLPLNNAPSREKKVRLHAP